MNYNQNPEIMHGRFLLLILAAVLTFALLLPVSSAGTACDIDAETAALIAKAFVTDNVRMNIAAVWTEETAVNEVVALYGTDGTVSAYSAELMTSGQDSGYVIISAYADVENLILEYAEEAEPLYAAFGNTEGETVIYTGLTGYFLEKENGTYETLNGDNISEDEIGESTLEELRSPAHYTENRGAISSARNGRSLFAEVDGSIVYNPEGFSSQSADSGIAPCAIGDIEITNPTNHANQFYEGPFVPYSYRNDWENYAAFSSMDHLAGNDGLYNGLNYAPTALTNFVDMFGERFNMTNITPKTARRLYIEVTGIGIEHNFFFPTMGTYQSSLPEYFQYVCDYYGIYYNEGSIEAKIPTFDNVVYQLNNGGPFYLTIRYHGYYGYHAVVAYGYIRLVSQTTGYYKSYIKVSDGYADSGRYIDMSSICNVTTGEMISWTW